MPSLEIIFCPTCGEEIYRHVPHQIKTKMSLPSRTQYASAALTAIYEEADRAYQERLLSAENACILHIQERHPIRYRLWKRLGWNHIVTLRLRRRAKPKYPDDVQTYVFGGLK